MFQAHIHAERFNTPGTASSAANSTCCARTVALQGETKSACESHAGISCSNKCIVSENAAQNCIMEIQRLHAKKLAKNCPQSLPIRSPGPSKTSQNRALERPWEPKCPQKVPQTSQETPQSAQEAPKRRLRSAQEPPKSAQKPAKWRPRGTQECPRPLQNGARRAPRQVSSKIFVGSSVRQAPGTILSRFFLVCNMRDVRKT